MIPGIMGIAGFISTTAPSGPWSPLDLTDLAAWYDADQQTEAADAEVETLVDQSGNGFDFTNDIGGTLRYNFVNGKKAIQSSTNAYANGTLLPGGTTACAAFWVVKGTSDPSSAPNDRGVVNGFGTGGLAHYYADGNWYESFGTTSRRNVNPPTSWANWHVAGVTSASNDFKMWWNGTDLGVTASPNTVTVAGGTRNLLGLFAGHFAELIFCDAVPSTSDRQKIEGYLAHKYGFESDLPGGHPYLSSPP